MGLFANPDLGGWLSNVGSDFGSSFSDLANGVQGLGASLGLGGAPQVNPMSQLQAFYSLGANTPTSLADWYAQAAQAIPALTGAVTPSFASALSGLGSALSPAAPSSPMALPSASSPGLSGLSEAQQQAAAAASGATSAGQSASQPLGSGAPATAPRFAAPVLSRPVGLQFGAGFGAPLP